jgi:hypothetical protein
MIENERLVQYSELKPTEKVDSPDKIPGKILQSWWNAAKNICERDGYTALAFNQIPKETLSKLGFEGVNPSIIYVGNIDRSHGSISKQLLINPEIQTTNILGDDVSIEACGSIIDRDGINPEMFVLRPAVIVGGAYFWKPGEAKASPKEFSTALASGSVIQHEVKHLEGKTALSDPSQILDFSDEYVLKELAHKYLRLDRFSMLGLLIRFKHWLVYDKPKDKFKIVGSRGGFIRNEFN